MQIEALILDETWLAQSKKMLQREDQIWDGVRETCETVYGMEKRSKHSLLCKWRTLSKECQTSLSCRESERKRRITGNIDSDEMGEYTQELYASRRSGKKIAPRLRYHEAVDYLSKYPKFSETEEISYLPMVVLPSRQNNTDTEYRSAQWRKSLTNGWNRTTVDCSNGNRKNRKRKGRRERRWYASKCKPISETNTALSETVEKGGVRPK